MSYPRVGQTDGSKQHQGSFGASPFITDFHMLPNKNLNILFVRPKCIKAHLMWHMLNFMSKFLKTTLRLQ
uniref:Uncharacterized protein n=1 Tax=Arundo donax TaxID=35708 RepID=A0A0A9B9N9_ARUDO